MTRHPAVYSKTLFSTVVEWTTGDEDRILDPMAGVGTLATVIPGVFLNELEPEWARQCQGYFGVGGVTISDARHLPFPDGAFVGAITSPTYANRMADHHEARDSSRRNTYRHTLGRPLHPANTGQLQWGEAYREMHRQIWAEVWRVVSGWFILNISDHIRKGVVIPVANWHLDTCLEQGFLLLEDRKVSTPRQRYGANGDLRVDHERMLLFAR